MGNTAIQITKAQASMVAQGILFTLKAQLVRVPISRTRITLTVSIPAIQCTQLALVILVNLATTFEIKIEIVVRNRRQIQTATDSVIATFNRRSTALADL